MSTTTTNPKAVGEEALQAAMDAVMGFDPSQAPRDLATLQGRLTVPQPSIGEAMELLIGSGQAKYLPQALPLVFTLLEAPARAFPAEWGEIRQKGFVMTLPAAVGEARTVMASNGVERSPTRDRQPVLAALVDKYFFAENTPTKQIPTDERTGLYGLFIAILRSIDKQLMGAEKPFVAVKTPGRNDPCHCGSGKKFKKCHGA